MPSFALFALRAALCAAAAGAVFTVPLSKQRVPVVANNRTVTHKTAYFGDIFVGLPSPQNFTVVFDTGSGHLFIPGDNCQDQPCLRHRRYKRSASGSGVAINDDGEPSGAGAEERDRVSIAYGTGKIVGEFVREAVCLGAPRAPGPAGNGTLLAADDQHCAMVRVVTATQMTAEPFSAFAFDGVLGLGLSSLALDPEFHFFGQMVRGSDIEQIFSVFLSKREDVASEIAFGGHDERRMLTPFRWAQVEGPEDGYWRVHVTALYIGDQRLPFCDDGLCNAILDTGTSMLGVPQEILQTMMVKTARVYPGDPSEVDCREFAGPAITFEMGSFSIMLEAEDYSRPGATKLAGRNASQNASRTVCRASLLPVSMAALGPKLFLWGEPVLRKYYTAYDSKRQQVGFALSPQSTLKVSDVTV